MTKGKLHTTPKFTKVDPEVKVETGKTATNQRIDTSVGIDIRIKTEEITIGIIIGPITEIGQETIIGMTIGKTTIDQVIGETITGLMIGKTVTDKMIGETILDKTIEDNY